jgi:hypothetical protein
LTEFQKTQTENEGKYQSMEVRREKTKRKSCDIGRSAHFD